MYVSIYLLQVCVCIQSMPGAYKNPTVEFLKRELYG